MAVARFHARPACLRLHSCTASHLAIGNFPIGLEDYCILVIHNTSVAAVIFRLRLYLIVTKLPPLCSLSRSPFCSPVLTKHFLSAQGASPSPPFGSLYLSTLHDGTHLRSRKSSLRASFSAIIVRFGANASANASIRNRSSRDDSGQTHSADTFGRHIAPTDTFGY